MESTFGTHVLETFRMLGADPLARDEACSYRFESVERPSSPGFGDLIDEEFADTLPGRAQVDQAAFAARLVAVEHDVRRLRALEREVEQLKEQLSQRAPTARALSMLDALIGDYKPIGPSDEDEQFLAMALTTSEGE